MTQRTQESAILVIIVSLQMIQNRRTNYMKRCTEQGLGENVDLMCPSLLNQGMSLSWQSICLPTRMFYWASVSRVFMGRSCSYHMVHSPNFLIMRLVFARPDPTFKLSKGHKSLHSYNKDSPESEDIPRI